MAQTPAQQLTDFYMKIQQTGKLRTVDHARRWTAATLSTLGLNLDRKSKKKLSQVLPPELANDLTRTFWLLHFRDPNLSSHEFLNQIALRSGNTDPNFARLPVRAVFHFLKELIEPEVSEQVAQSLSPEVAELWRNA